MGEYLAADVEGDGFLDQLTTIWCLSVAPLDNLEDVTTYSDYMPGAPSLVEGLQRLRDAEQIGFHNGLGYDYWAINKLYPGTVKFRQIYDTLVVARLLDPESFHSLGIWGETFGFPKGDVTKFDEWTEDFVPYCERDVKICGMLWQRQLKVLDDWGDSVQIEHQVAFIIAQQQMHGFRLNVEKAQALTMELRAEMASLETALQDIFPPVWVPADTSTWCWKDRTWSTTKTFLPKRNDNKLGYVKDAPVTKVKLQSFNPGSRQHIIQRLSKIHGWKPTKFTPNGAPAVDEDVLSNLRYPEAIQLNTYFNKSKQLGQISDGDNGWLKLVNEKNYVHGQVNPIGARTHRMSHFKPNMAQVSKKDIRMREVWEPDEGEVLVGSDAEGLELRMLGHYLGRHDDGAFAHSVVFGDKSDGTDAHSRNREAGGLHLRDSAKTGIYAYLYGAGNPKLGCVVVDDAAAAKRPKPKGSLASLGKRLRTGLESGIAGLGSLINGVKKTHKRRGKFRSLDGRWLTSVSAHSALNTLLQGGGAVVMKWALVIFHFETAVEKGWVNAETFECEAFGYCANVHDEVQMSCPPEIAQEVGDAFTDAIRIAGERLGLRCPLAGAVDIGKNWADTH
jgi:DNA polymerase-1